jgi:hypothetical protein
LKHVLLAAVVSVVVGPAIIGGSVVGAMFSHLGLLLGAIVGAVLGVLTAVRAAVWWRLIAPEAQARTVIGALIGFALASATLRLWDTPVQAALSGLLVPLGALVGRWTRRI